MTNDKLSIVKAAAWAWYQHGSRYQSEFVFTRTTDQRVVANYKPSRYMLQAMKIVAEEETILETSSSSSGPIQTDNNSLLLDNYESETISNKLDQLVESRDDKFCDETKKSSSKEGSSAMLKKKTQRVIRAFWVRHGVVCGTRQDVVNKSFGIGLLEKRTPVVKMTACRPWFSHASGICRCDDLNMG
ncbi:hypothetical protein Ddye_026341 [Dipteronia dyeriana]|uniref:Uncharacterized protein n=1 Tax=Dipteronia dyeriana TaxID=168575 RepID=A0AAD9TM39_9ROSI|nr:hypothetical protein Ddye_026341 [Dipteronia dyeriana]